MINRPSFKKIDIKRSSIEEVISCLLIFLFIYASVSKLKAYKVFEVQLSKSPFITSFAGILTWALPTIELITAVFLGFRALRLCGLYLSLFLMTLFTAYLVAMLNFSYYIPCSCGGVLSGLTWKQHIVFNLFFLLICIIGIIIRSKANLLIRNNIKIEINI